MTNLRYSEWTIELGLVLVLQDPLTGCITLANAAKPVMAAFPGYIPLHASEANGVLFVNSELCLKNTMKRAHNS